MRQLERRAISHNEGSRSGTQTMSWDKELTLSRTENSGGKKENHGGFAANHE